MGDYDALEEFSELFDTKKKRKRTSSKQAKNDKYRVYKGSVSGNKFWNRMNKRKSPNEPSKP